MSIGRASAVSKSDLAVRVGRVQLFSSLNPEQLSQLLTYAVHRKIPRTQMMVALGEKTDSFYVILSGAMRVVVGDEEGREVIVSILNSGDFFGEMGIIDDEPRSASVVSAEPCEILVFSKDSFRAVLTEYPAVSWQLMRSLAQRLRVATRKIETLALMDVYGRVARLLLDFSEDADSGKRFVSRRLSKQDIARMVGASREMVSRVMRDLTDRGLIQAADGKIYLSSRLGVGL
ncbi:Crp/Fnr family transcriptional regulator [Candidatus Ichthyocystis hellenicum]|uniref:Crp/Fnr family transcriptional regulator n=1 Tax=Candidatus Ichthyocystis hellenicum TaxID=1561003 RepID=UPI000B88FCBC|nr:cyclic nucleotide-binding domain-containing protein [Candidatus Ichthyocystis hellenicum]